jgi:hypothetical protein
MRVIGIVVVESKLLFGRVAHNQKSIEVGAFQADDDGLTLAHLEFVDLAGVLEFVVEGIVALELVGDFDGLEVVACSFVVSFCARLVLVDLGMDERRRGRQQ